MNAYRHVSGHSGVTHYELGHDYMKILFTNGSLYLYNSDITGKEHIIKMKQLAKQGKGLSTYISKHVKDKYAAKLK